MAETFEMHGMGWLADYPDFRDHTVLDESIPARRQVSAPTEPLPVRTMLEAVGVLELEKEVPNSADLREWCSPIEDQDTIGSCTAHAGAGLVEYFERKAFGRHIDASRLFLYKVTRNLMQRSGDTGAFLRTTKGALALFGVPPEEYYPYNVADYDNEPPAFCYSFAQSFQAIDYFRLDPPGTSTEELLQRIKTHLAGDLPSMFGFTVFDSISQAQSTGRIPFPTRQARAVGGHAVVAVGYDDEMDVEGSKGGALLIRNSWGTDWGDDGYGWLPYEYVLGNLAVDWWSILKTEWVDTGNFKV
jgi:C1A family cysteine protease